MSSAPADSASASSASATRRSSRVRKPTQRAEEAAGDVSSDGSRRVRQRTEGQPTKQQRQSQQQHHQQQQQAGPAAGQQTRSHCTSVSLTSLHTVELQLVMHACDRRSLLSLARCSRSTLAAASSDFAWRCLSPMRICSSTPQLTQKLQTSLLRFVDVALWWTVGSGVRPRDGEMSTPFVQPNMNDARMDASEVDAIVSVPRLRGLDASRRVVPTVYMERLLGYPACARLTELMMNPWEFIGAAWTPAVLRLFPERLPELRVLHCTKIKIDSESDSDVLAPLGQLRKLEVLHLNLPTGGGLQSLTGCENLRELSLRGGDESQWPTLLAAPALQTLTAIDLHFLGSNPTPSIDAWAAAFANLHALTSVEIYACPYVDERVLLLCARCPSLRLLTLCTGYAWSRTHCCLPSESVLRSLLSSLPQLHVRMSLCVDSWSHPRSSMPWWGVKGSLDAKAASAKLTQEFSGRVQLIEWG